jgi:hypothetical protein
MTKPEVKISGHCPFNVKDVLKTLYIRHGFIILRLTAVYKALLFFFNFKFGSPRTSKRPVSF